MNSVTGKSVLAEFAHKFDIASVYRYLEHRFFLPPTIVRLSGWFVRMFVCPDNFVTVITS